MPESQNIEWKQSWRDEYLKWICGFANAKGGKIYLGKDDKGKVVGVENYKRLMDDIPNKICNLMGITAEVNLFGENGNQFIEIAVPSYSVPISLRGRYYYRSGSTKQELTGASLNEFLLEKSGRTWDDVIEPRATLDDIDEVSIEIFLKAAEKAGRLPENEGLAIPELLEKLRLTETNNSNELPLFCLAKIQAGFTLTHL